ncbi:dihydroneopterin aldolase [Microlunatus panaciterrae]|uniref:7,8-dihydroneopterin aldolase n=1 Tax=Microlunatus panaciterrae TaxID=400768 RepID=A0ABS2RHE7_9ACTN|nr:dihydroneopterin aldolase [Microlunatus panaciterrae]MBM7798429.1 dihydroneopterin aldolase [Microlunatus panaciterrae]
MPELPVRHIPPADAPDRVALKGISGFGHHGVFAFEREQGQRFVVDVVCALDLEPAARSDDLTDTLDYGSLAAAVVKDIEGEPLDLIESLAARIARTCLSNQRVDAVEVTVHKPDAPMPVDVADVAVTLTRSRTYE